MGCASLMAPVEPENNASPKAKIPHPGDEPVAVAGGVAAIPTMGWASLILPVDPRKRRREGEDPAVRRHQPVAVAAGGGGHPDDGLGQLDLARRPEEGGVAEAKIPPSDATSQ